MRLAGRRTNKADELHLNILERVDEHISIASVRPSPFTQEFLDGKVSGSYNLDESITSVNRAAKAIKIGACRWINIKTSRVGGLTNALAIHDLCMAKDVPIWVGGMLESAVGQGPSLALATKRNVGYPCDIFPSSRFFDEDFSVPEIILSGKGKITAPTRSGAGFNPKMDFLKDTAF